MPKQKALPNLSFEVDLPEILWRAARVCNSFARLALGDELEKHHRTRIPLHFRLSAHDTYGYKPRLESTRTKKERFWRKPKGLDLVRTGQTASTIMGTYQITFGGGIGGPMAANGASGLQGRLNMRLPFSVSRDNSDPRKVSIDNMKDEITSTTADEQKDIAEGFTAGFARRLATYRGPTRKKKLS